MQASTRLHGSVSTATLMFALGCVQAQPSGAAPGEPALRRESPAALEATASGPSASPVLRSDGQVSRSEEHDRPGYTTYLHQGRLWIFRTGSGDLSRFTEQGEPAKSVIRPAAGPDRLTIKAVDAETIDGYLRSNSAYAAFVVDGRLWVFRAGSRELSSFLSHGEPAKSVTRPRGGPDGMTVKAVDAATIDGYMHCRPGFVTFMDEGRLWIFREGAADLAKFLQHGEPARVVIRPGAGPNRMTLKAVDAETIDDYMLLVRQG